MFRVSGAKLGHLLLIIGAKVYKERRPETIVVHDKKITNKYIAKEINKQKKNKR